MMKLSTSVACGLLLLSPLVFAQQTVTRPVLSAAPLPQAPTPPSAAPSSASSQVSPNYVIGPEDSLQVTVWKEPNLTGPLSVRPDGKISLPLLGDVPASGLTPMLLGDDLATRLKKYITDPLVTVTVLAVNSKHIFLLGEIQHIGPITFTPGMSILQAISVGGGLTPFANSKHIYLLRGQPGSQKKLFFNYKKAIKDGNEQGLKLESGDTVVVP